MAKHVVTVGRFRIEQQINKMWSIHDDVKGTIVGCGWEYYECTRHAYRYYGLKNKGDE